MKKVVFGILIACLVLGIPLIIISALSEISGTAFVYSGAFSIPTGYNKIEVDLSKSDRENELLNTISIDKPSLVDFYIQTDSHAYKSVQVVGQNKFIGTESNTFTLLNGSEQIMGGSNITLSLIADRGKYNVVLSNAKASGKVVVCYKITDINGSDFERLKKIDSGELDNPPEGFNKVFSAELKNKSSQDEKVYAFTLDKAQTVDFSAYANVRSGSLNLSIKGENYSSYLISENYYIRDRFQRSLARGKYEIVLTSSGVNGELYVFVKK